MASQYPTNVPGEDGTIHPPPQQPQQPPLPADGPAFMKLTRGTSCVLCQQRKVRCDKKKPCSNCAKAGVECRVVPPQPPRRRKKRLQEKDLLERLHKYEALLRENNINFEGLDHDTRGNEVDELENDFENLKTTPEDNASPSSSTASRWTPGPMFSLHRDFHGHENTAHDSSDDEFDYSIIYRAFDKMFSNQDPFQFLLSGHSQLSSITDAHPPTIHILQLWQIYIDNVNPLFKLTHVPSVQQELIKATSNLENAPKNIEALMFAIYLMAITSLDEEEVQIRFQASKHELLGRYFAAIQQALVNAGFMRSRDLITLQAFFLYLFAIRWFLDPRQVFNMMAIVVRIAQHMGLHHDPEGHGMSAMEVEQRRRLWWTIVAYDRRIGEMTGATVTALSAGTDTKLPLNINDADLYAEGKDLPKAHDGPTEMLFCLSRLEMVTAVTDQFNRDIIRPLTVTKSGLAEKITIRLAGQNSPTYTIDGFCAHIEGTYLVHCDTRIPLHFFTQIMARQSLCRTRVLVYLVRLAHSDPSTTDEAEREDIFSQALQMVEYDNVAQSSESIKHFRWYTMHYFPFPAYMFLVNELRYRVSGPMVDRVWQAISNNHELRGMLNNLHSPMHIAFGHLFIKAWRAYETASNAAGVQPAKPRFILILEDKAEKNRQIKAGKMPDPALTAERISVPKSSPSSSHNTPPSHPDSGVATMTTPPVGQSPVGPGGGSSGGAVYGAPPQMVAAGMEDTEMDWAYILSGYQDGSLFGGGFFGGMPNVGGGGGNGMGGMGGMGSAPGPGGMNMFGNQ